MSRRGGPGRRGGRRLNTGAAPPPARPQSTGTDDDDEVYLTPRVRRLRRVVWAMLAGWLVLAVLAVVLVRVL